MEIPNLDIEQFYAVEICKMGLTRPFIQQFSHLTFQFVMSTYES